KQRRCGLGHVDAIVVEPPQQRSDRDVEHLEVVAEHVVVLDEDRRELREPVADLRTRLVHRLRRVARLVATLELLDVDEQLALEIRQEQPRARTQHRIGRPQLPRREALVDVLVDDVRLVQDQVALDQDRNLAVRIHDRDVLGLVVEIDVADLEVHALLEQHEAAALRERASRAGIQHHHDRAPERSGYRMKKIRVSPTADSPCIGSAPPGYLTSFQYSRFRYHAMTVKTPRKSITHTPSRVRVWAVGSDMYVM